MSATLDPLPTHPEPTPGSIYINDDFFDRPDMGLMHSNHSSSDSSDSLAIEPWLITTNDELMACSMLQEHPRRPPQTRRDPGWFRRVLIPGRTDAPPDDSASSSSSGPPPTRRHPRDLRPGRRPDDRRKTSAARLSQAPSHSTSLLPKSWGPRSPKIGHQRSPKIGHRPLIRRKRLGEETQKTTTTRDTRRGDSV